MVEVNNTYDGNNVGYVQEQKCKAYLI